MIRDAMPSPRERYLRPGDRTSLLRHLLMALALCVLVPAWLAAAGDADADQFAALFYLSFDGTVDAAAPGAHVTVVGGEGIRFAQGQVGNAADFREHGCLEYRGLPMLNLKEGTIELWIKAAHDRKEMKDHYYLQFLKDDGSAGIEIKFYHVECSAQVTMWTPKSKFRRYGWGWAEDAWRQIVVTWDATGQDQSGLTLYLNGIESGYPRPYKPIQMPDMLRVGCKSPQEGHVAKALIDEVAVYNRCLTRLQVKTLFEHGDKPLAEKVTRARERIAKDAASDHERNDMLFNHRKLGMIHGRFTSLLHWHDEAFTPLGIPVPDKVHETKLASTDLSQYHVLFVPGGGGLRLDDANKEALQKYVRQGGGYVGICGGAVTAARYGLIDAQRYPFDVRGPVFNMLKEHPITEGYDIKRKLLFPHASGPLFVLKEGSGETPVAVFRVGAPPLPTFVNTIAKHYGKGRVVAFSGHPEGSPQTRMLLRNAILWAAKITGETDTATDAQ